MKRLIAQDLDSYYVILEDIVNENKNAFVCRTEGEARKLFEQEINDNFMDDIITKSEFEEAYGKSYDQVMQECSLDCDDGHCVVEQHTEEEIQQLNNDEGYITIWL